MTAQFELGTKHLENKKNALSIIKEINSPNPKEVLQELYKRSTGILPSSDGFYNDYLGLVVLIEEIAKENAIVASLMVDQILAQEIFSRYAQGSATFDKEQTYAVLCSEPGIAEVEALGTKAAKKASSWSLQGKKQISDEQQIADKFLIFAKDEDNKTRVFVTNKEDLIVERISNNISGVDIQVNTIDIDLNIDEDQNIAVIKDDYENVTTIARTLIAAVASGIAHSCVSLSIDIAKKVKGADGLPISSKQSLQFEIADMYAELEAGRMLAYYSASLIDSNTPNIKYATSAKVQATNAAAGLSVEALQILGNMGYIANDQVANLVKTAINTQVKGGTNRAQKNLIYKYMLAKK